MVEGGRRVDCGVVIDGSSRIDFEVMVEDGRWVDCGVVIDGLRKGSAHPTACLLNFLQTNINRDFVNLRYVGSII